MLKCRPSIPQFIRELKVKTLKSYSPVYWVSTLTGYQCKNTKVLFPSLLGLNSHWLSM